MNGLCIHCGAPISIDKNRCPYCGCLYEYGTKTIKAQFDSSESIGELIIGEEKIVVYIGAVESTAISDSYRDEKGRVHGNVISHRSFTLIEV